MPGAGFVRQSTEAAEIGPDTAAEAPADQEGDVALFTERRSTMRGPSDSMNMAAASSCPSLTRFSKWEKPGSLRMESNQGSCARRA